MGAAMTRMAMSQTGSFELKKFAHRKADYAKSLDEILRHGSDAHD
jgi:hypothetical protein